MPRGGFTNPFLLGDNIKIKSYTGTSNKGGVVGFSDYYPEFTADNCLILLAFNTNDNDVVWTPYVYWKNKKWYLKPINASSSNNLVSPPANSIEYDMVVYYVNIK